MDLPPRDPLLLREQRFHDAAFSDDRRQAVRPFYRITAASRRRYLQALTRPEHRRVLEWGCGPGSSAMTLAERGASVSAIDISPVAIRRARSQASGAGVDLDLRVMDAHHLEYGSETFDLVCGQGILHHLRTRDAYREMARVLRPTGCAVFLEPLGHNPFINAFRRVTPSMRSPDEHPLRRRDIRDAYRHFARVDASFFHLTSLALTPARNQPWLERITPLTDTLDRALFRILPPLRWWGWIAILELREPIHG